jgi:hypothetical protein
VAENTEAEKARTTSERGLSGEEAIRNLVALPLRMLAGTFGLFEEVLWRASDTLREIDPLDQRIVELESRVDSLEGQTASRRESVRSTSAARKSAGEPEGSGSLDPAPDKTPPP